MYHMGGLRRKMPLTYAAMLIASLSLMGMPVFFSGFWSKDMVLESALLSGQYPLLILGLITVSVTCFYTVRMLGLVFHGKPSERQSSEVAGGHLHLVDPSPKMTIPYLLLAAATVALGWSDTSRRSGSRSSSPGTTRRLRARAHSSLGGADAAAGHRRALNTIPPRGRGACLLDILPRRTPAPSGPLSAIRGLLFRRYYINALYYSLFVRPTMWLSGQLYSAVEVGFFDRLNAGIAAAARSVSSGSGRATPGPELQRAGVRGRPAILMVIILVAVIW
jgi:NADH-quinone oxidoreductase subunit L